MGIPIACLQEIAPEPNAFNNVRLPRAAAPNQYGQKTQVDVDINDALEVVQVEKKDLKYLNLKCRVS